MNNIKIILLKIKMYILRITRKPSIIIKNILYRLLILIKKVKLIHYIILVIGDYINKIKDKGYKGYGLHMYVGLFGGGKTSSMIRDAYEIALTYPEVTILTNMEIYNFPEHTNIEKLIDFQQIVNAKNNTLVLVDEISSIFNNRKWQTNGIPDELLFTLLQCRKRNIEIFGTAQQFNHIDVFFRKITFSVRECTCMTGRWNFIHVFDGYVYENSKAPRYDYKYSFIQTNFIRSLYDTREIIKMIKDNSEGGDQLVKLNDPTDLSSNVAGEIKPIKRIKRNKKQTA